MGLGLLGRGVGDAIFLAECGTDLVITDLQDDKTLAPSIRRLKKYENIKYVLGKHRLEDFVNRDFILKAAGVPLDSPYIAEAKKHDVPIEMDASLFAKLMPKGVTLVGVTGTRGKSTTTALIYEILKQALGKKALGTRKIYKGGNLVSEATLPLLKKVSAGDIVVLELDSWQLQGFHDAKVSPQVAVFTTFFDDHLSYYKNDRMKYLNDKVAIFQYQKKGDVLVVGEQTEKQVIEARPSVAPLVARAADIPEDWKIKLLGEHNRQNIACAIAAARAVLKKLTPDVPRRQTSGVKDIQKAIERFGGLPNRLEYLRTVRGVKIYNDNNATTPDATIAALRALSLSSSRPFLRGSTRAKRGGGGSDRGIVLIMGGIDKGLDMSQLITEIPMHCKAVVFLKESGTEKIKRGVKGIEKETLRECVKEAIKIAEKDDIILFSPAFASFGRWFKNEYDRGEQFVKIVKELSDD